MPPYWGTYDGDGGGGSGNYEDTQEIEAVAAAIAEDRFDRWLKERRPGWLSNKILAIVVILLFLLGLGFLIAGAIMLGIGVSKSHTTSSNCSNITASPYYATVLSSKVTWTDVQTNYEDAANTVADQVRSALTSSSSKAAFFDTSANKDPYITVLGLSQSNSSTGGIMAVVGMAYTSADAPSTSSVQNSLDHGDEMTLYHVSPDAANSPSQQMCNQVSFFQQPTVPNGATSSTSTTSFLTTKAGTATVSTVRTTVPTTECVCPTVTCPTSSPTSPPTTSTMKTVVTTKTSPTTSTPPVTTTSSTPIPTTSTQRGPTTVQGTTTPLVLATTSAGPAGTTSTSQETSPTTGAATSSTTAQGVTTSVPSTSEPAGTSTTGPISQGSSQGPTTGPVTTPAVSTSGSVVSSSAGTTSQGSTTGAVTTPLPSTSGAAVTTSSGVVSSQGTSQGPTTGPVTTSVPSTSGASVAISTGATSSPGTSQGTTSGQGTTSAASTTGAAVSTSAGVVSSQGTSQGPSTGPVTTSVPSTSGAPVATSTGATSSPGTSQRTTSGQGTTPASSTSGVGTTSQGTSQGSSQGTTSGQGTTSAPSTSVPTSLGTIQGSTTGPISTSAPSTTGFGTTSQGTTAGQVTTSGPSTAQSTATSSSGATSQGTTSGSVSTSPLSTSGASVTSSTATTSQGTTAEQVTTSILSTIGTTVTSSTGATSQETTAGPTTAFATVSSSQSTSQGTTNVATTTSAQSTVASSQGTSPQTTPAASTTTTSPTTPTTSACIPVTTALPRPGARDVVVLIDDSTAVGNVTNYNQVTSWLGGQLFVLWPVSSEKWEAAPAQYAQYEFNLLMDFDANSVAELTTAVTSSIFSGRKAPSLTKALKSTLNLSGREGVHRVILLLSASLNSSDLETALPLAEQAKAQGSDIITVALGGIDAGLLGILSSGPEYTFPVLGFTPSAEQATQITDLIQGGSRSTSQATTTLPPSTTVALVDFPCHPDIAVLVDTSADVSSQQEYERQLDFVRNLSASWPISPSALETEVVVYSSTYGGFIGQKDYAYQSAQEFSEVIQEYYYFYNKFAQPSINGTLSFLAGTVDNRRTDRTPTTLLFVYSGNKDDVISARSSLSSVGNLIIVGMGQHNDYLTLLTGNVITGLDYGDALTSKINSLLCSPSSPAPLPSTTHAPVTTNVSITTTNLPTTTTPTTKGTTVTPQSCPDCFPDEANILLAMDSSSLMAGGSLDLLKSFVNTELTSNWTHPERLAVLGFDDRTHFFAPVDFGDLTTMDEYHTTVSVAPQLPNPPSLTSAFQHALQNFHSIPKFGSQKTVIFTMSANPADIANATGYAQVLSQRGTVVVVGMNMSDVTALHTLVPSVIPWPNLTDSTGIADQIQQGLAGAFLNYTTLPATSTIATTVTGSTVSSTVISTSAAATTTTTTAGTTTLFTASPAICSRDVILLIDESNAYTDMASFNKVKSWIINTLVPLWEVNPKHISVAPYGFANKTFNDLGGDFLVNSQSELETLIQANLKFYPGAGPNVHSAMVKAASIQTRPGAATVVISASDSADDVNQGLSAANQLKQNGGTVITLAVGPNFSGQLGKLSSGLDFTFFSRDFAVSTDIAVDISDVLCSSAPVVSTTAASSSASSTPTTTTTAPLPPFPCSPDVAFLFDSSALNSNQSLFAQTVLYVSDQLITNWVVDAMDTEAAIIMGNSILPVHDSTSWRYSSREELQETLRDMSANFFGGAPSIHDLFTELQQNVYGRRSTAPLTAVMFTFSSDQNDVISSTDIVNQLGVNVVAVGLGSSTTEALGLLTGNVVAGMPLGANLSAWINAAICNPKPPISTVPPETLSTTIIPATTSTATTSQSTTVTLPATTTLAPEGCPDCYPNMANILILLDNSNDQSFSTFVDQKQAASSLVLNWTHFERVALASYASSLSQILNFGDLQPNDSRAIQIAISHVQNTTSPPDLGRSLHQATSILPNPLYGEQKTILFTASDIVSDKASQAGQVLRARGQLIVVGIGMADVTALSGLASPGDAIPWGDVRDINYVVNAILKALGNSTRPSPTTTVSTTLQTTTIGTTTAASTATASCAKDVLLLIDDSNAYGSPDNFNKTRTWIVNSLVPTWNVSPSKIAVVVAGFANKSWNPMGGDFGDIDSVPELQLLLNQQLFYLSGRGPSLSYGLGKAVSVSRAETLTILVSASEEPDDINSAYPSAMKLREYGAALITLFVGPTSKGFLGTLASGKNFSFVSTDYSPSQSTANMISSLICGPEPLFTTTPLLSTSALPTTTVTAPPAPFNCNPDVAFLFDSSATNSNSSVLATVMNYVADSLISNWMINPLETEGAVVQATSKVGIIDPDPWKYRSEAELADELHRMSADGTLFGDPSVEGLISYLQTVAQSRRQGASLTAVMFTFSTDYSDVVASLPAANQLGANIIAIGLGSSDAGTLGLLTGNFLIPTGLGSSVTQFINSAVCNPKPPVAVPTTSTARPTSTFATSSTTMAATLPPTTVPVEGCPDCFPAMANLLIVLDNSMNQTADTFNYQKEAVLSLVSNWTHFERVALASFASTFSVPLSYHDIPDLATFQIVLNSISQIQLPADLGKALHSATGVVPDPEFGQQQVILFTTTVDNSDKAQASAATLRSKGQLVMVGVAMSDVSGLKGLSSPQSTIAWFNVSDTYDVVQDILTDLGNNATATTGTSSLGTTTTMMTSTLGTTTAASTATASCAKDVLLLIDDSNAYGSPDNFNKTRSWIVNSLVPTWNVSPSKIAVVVAGFANKSWNPMSGDFGDIDSVPELQLLLNQQLFYLSGRGPSLSYGLGKAVSVSRAETVTILLSASEEPDDINSAYPSAMKLREYGAALITLFVGPTSKGYLGTLASGKNFSFVSTDYSPSQSTANMISSLICGPEPLFTTTPLLSTSALPTTTVTAPPAPFNCNPDVAFLFDSSATNSNDSVLAATINYVANDLLSTWMIDQDDIEGAAILATSSQGIHDSNSWRYASRVDFQAELKQLSYTATMFGESSVEGLLNYLQDDVQGRRQTAPLTAVMFTFSTDYSDVVASLPAANQLGANIIAIGLGSSDAGTLGLLTGNFLTPSGLGSSVTQFINSAVCNPKPPVAVPTTSTARPTTTFATSSTTMAATLPPTTVPVEGCPDCFPAMANLLIVLDNSMNQTADTFNYQKEAVLNLVSNWTHFERVALASFASTFSVPLSYHDIPDLAIFQIVLDSIAQIQLPADLGKALHSASGVVPDPEFGQQQVILFTTTVDNSDKAKTSAANLQSKGELVIVGVAMSDVSGLMGLSSPGAAIAWSDVSDTQGVVGDIMGTLGATTRPTEEPTSTTYSPQAPSTASATTTPPGNVCPNDLILLLDDSTAIPDDGSFNQLKTWVTGSLLVQLPPSVLVYAFAYDTKNYNDLTGGFIPAAAATGPVSGGYFYNKQNGPNITRALSKADAIVAPDGTVSTLLISASANADDVKSAGTYANVLKEKGGLVTVLVGKEGDGLLPLASGPGLSFSTNSFSPSNDLLNSVIAAICSNPATLSTTVPITTTVTSRPTPTTVAPTTSQLTSTSNAPSTSPPASTSAVASTQPPVASSSAASSTSTLPPTTVIPVCPDCFPAMANLLIVVDNSMNQTADTFNYQKEAVLSLVSNWTHFERVALASFASTFSVPLSYHDIPDLATFQIVLDSIAQIQLPADLGKALHSATGVVPDPEFGQQQVILFTTTVDNSDKAQSSAADLQSKGQLIMIGVAMPNVSGLKVLSSPGAAIAWSDVSDTYGVVQDILTDLGNSVTATSV